MDAQHCSRASTLLLHRDAMRATLRKRPSSACPTRLDARSVHSAARRCADMVKRCELCDVLVVSAALMRQKMSEVRGDGRERRPDAR
jgi:hypothetical protein